MCQAVKLQAPSFTQGSGFAASALVIFIGLSMTGCVSSGEVSRPPSAIQKALIGTSKAGLLKCAGMPKEEHQIGHDIILTYHGDAPISETSFMGSKSSVTGRHHGCTARLRLTNDRVDGVEYVPEPSDFVAEDHCDQIFTACGLQ